MIKELKELLGESAANEVLTAAESGLPIVIDGRQGPTGKSTLCRALRAEGYEVTEAYEREKSDGNTACITITLNKYVL